LKAIAANPKRSRPVGYAGVFTADRNSRYRKSLTEAGCEKDLH
jgi:hypothetical protein